MILNYRKTWHQKLLKRFICSMFTQSLSWNGFWTSARKIICRNSWISFSLIWFNCLFRSTRINMGQDRKITCSTRTSWMCMWSMYWHSCSGDCSKISLVNLQEWWAHKLCNPTICLKAKPYRHTSVTWMPNPTSSSCFCYKNILNFSKDNSQSLPTSYHPSIVLYFSQN